MIARKNCVKMFGLAARRLAGKTRRWRRHFAKLLPDHLEAGAIVRCAIVRHAAMRGMHLSATQRLGIYCLTNRALHEVRSAEPHKAHFVDHDDYITKRR